MLIGVDEVNYSPSLAGDCVVCALLALPGFEKVDGVKDSKQTTHNERLRLFRGLQGRSLYAIVPATVNAINNIGIHQPRLAAMAMAIRMLLWEAGEKGLNIGLSQGKAILDGPFSERALHKIRYGAGWARIEGLVNADETVYEVSAASIVAKVYVDAMFEGFGKFWPGFRMEINHGSPDKIAYAKICRVGASPWHRTGYGKKWWEAIRKFGEGLYPKAKGGEER